MPRDLADVLHYFLPELDGDAEPGVRSEDPTQATPAARPFEPQKGISALPILGIPIGDRDVIRASLGWNLAVETCRLGGTSLFLAPESECDSPLWPAPGVGPLGCELIFSPAQNLASLYATANKLAHDRGRKAGRDGLVFVRIPPKWLIEETPPSATPDWLLLLTSPRAQDLGDALGISSEILKNHPGAEIGVTIFGVQTIAEARRAFDSLAHSAHAQTQIDLRSYGLLIDDLNVYRSIAAQRPIGHDFPQAPAARAIADVARLIYEDARSRVLG